MSATFRARYDGTCAADCDQRIDPGDEVTYLDGQLVHVGCEPVDDEPAPRPVCPICFTETALNGACAC
ncbi:hypothetical protein [Microbacterium sp. gxy059]|uniref:hypothetical protein n=1 Tax=Microbacterium sp. gxy059 TaxID=2957199 RepID=UPI003D9805B9